MMCGSGAWTIVMRLAGRRCWPSWTFKAEHEHSRVLDMFFMGAVVRCMPLSPPIMIFVHSILYRAFCSLANRIGHNHAAPTFPPRHNTITKRCSIHGLRRRRSKPTSTCAGNSQLLLAAAQPPGWGQSSSCRHTTAPNTFLPIRGTPRPASSKRSRFLNASQQ